MPEMTTASGAFDVTLTPQAAAEGAETDAVSRMTIAKRFHGELDATSSGQMLAAVTAVKGSAGYVAMERVSGTLAGRAGTFVLQHTGSMDRGAPSLAVTVVPDSGTGELVGVSGSMTIDMVDGRHLYALTYAIDTVT